MSSTYVVVLYRLLYLNLKLSSAFWCNSVSLRAEGRRGWKERGEYWDLSLFNSRWWAQNRICEKISAPTMQSPYLRHSNKKHHETGTAGRWLPVEGDRGWGVEPKIFFLSKLIHIPCTAECIDVNQMIMLTS